MLLMLGTSWWSFILRGSMAALFGLAALVAPGMTAEILTLLLAAFLVTDGIIAFSVSLTGRRRDIRLIYLLLEGITGIAIGILAYAWPHATLVAVALLVATWALITGMFEIMAAIRLRNEMNGMWLLGLAGGLSIVFGLVLFLYPRLAIAAMVLTVGIYCLLFGIALITLGLRLRKHNLIISL